jgi:hypothetical protein
VNDRDLVSGYVVPAVAASASGKVCVGGRCRSLANAPAYHDHNWGVWRDATWEWGTARGTRFSLVYGGVYSGEQVASPFFLTVLDSLGVLQALRFDRVDYQDFRPAPESPGVTVPGRFSIVARHNPDTVRLDVKVRHLLATRGGPASRQRYFVQMRGSFSISGRISGRVVTDSGSGFFETYVPAGRRQ